MRETSSHSVARLTGIIPQLLVTDLDRAIAYYREQLGFELDFVYESFYASVVRDGFAIHLKHADEPTADREHRKRNEHLDAYISVIGIRELFNEVQSRGAHVTAPLKEQPWSCLEFYVEDPDTHVLCFSERIG
jgi:uncharacterized glyoxalase superfamily protein PhnB